MISLQNVTLMRGQQTLLRDVNLVIHKGQRTGIIGRNGCGKTSFFRALAGDIPLEQGDIGIPAGLRLSVMSQETPGINRSAIDFVIDAHKEYRYLEEQLLLAEENEDGDEVARVHGEMDAIEGYGIQNLAEQLLSGLGFDKKDFHNTVKTFSGGWRVRLNLAAALISPSDLLMLDEPTNHLDLEAMVWLEQWVARYRGTLLLISHDRHFLDCIIDHVVSFDNEKLDTYKGNYSDYEKLRAAKMALQLSLFEKQKRRREEIEQFVSRFRVKASKAKQAQSRLKELIRMKEIVPAHIDSPFKFDFSSPGPLPVHLMQIEDLAIGFQEPLVKKMNLGISSESRIGLLGFNGSGKSTFLKVLAGQLSKLSGEIIRSKKLRVGYYAQHQVDALNIDAAPIELIEQACEVREAKTRITEQQMKNFLGGFDFHGERVNENIKNFSGGEKARLALAIIVWSKPNLLLMDEPTNHLDIEMCHALEMALQAYKGAMIIVSHDRHLLANTINEFYSINNGVLAEYVGSINDYESWVRKSNEVLSGTAYSATKSKIIKQDRKAMRQSSAAKRQKLAPLRSREKSLEKIIIKIGKELEKIEEELQDKNLYIDDRKVYLSELLQKQGRLKSELVEIETEWLEIQEKLELC